MFFQYGQLRNTQALFCKAQDEYKKGLAAQYKEPHAYQELLESLVKCSDAVKDAKQAQQYRNAAKEYERRAYVVKDPNVAIRGVEDILEK